MSRGKVIFLHPDLGLGGAERLVVDAALSLKNAGFDVSFITSHHDTNHCFDDTKNGSLPVKVVGDFLPRHVFGKFYALFAYLKMIICAFYIIMFEKPDLVFCDLVSACIPILRLKVPNVVFYCHFPDQLLSSRTGFLKRLYRIPIDWLEEKTTSKADKIFVNSKFTRSVFKVTFPSISSEPDILYPSINVKPFDEVQMSYDSFMDSARKYGFNDKAFILLSINRFERKKNVELSIKSLLKLQEKLKASDYEQTKLIIAGGYDSRVMENVEYHEELKKCAEDLGVADKVTFLKSPSDEEKIRLLKFCHVLLYTPSNEHFGIVPLEAMYCAKPVVAVNSGGPTETVLNGETGLLCSSTDEHFSTAVASLITDKKMRESMGEHGRQRFADLFSYTAFSEKLNKTISELIKK